MEEKKEDDFLPGFRTVQEFSADGFKRVVNAVKTFQALPQPGPSWDLYKSYPEFSREMKNARSKMLPMMTSLLKHVNISATDFRSRDVEEKFEFLVDCNDELLERIGTSLDDAEGIFKKGDIVVVDKAIASTALRPPGTWAKRKFEAINSAPDVEDTAVNTPQQSASGRQIKKAIFRTRVTEKPQLKFSKSIDNSTSPFVPKLKEKPHSLKPLSILPEYNSKNEEFYGHPYFVELNRWEPKDHMLTKATPTPPKPLKDTPLVYVSTPRDLERLMYDLLKITEIAVDLEHHSYRTYLGLTCTIQISSREKDYVIDGLSLRDQLANLNEVLADPKILKVFHGASNDIDWLQRDFGLYVVNMFDTYLASKVLQLPQHSLQYLLGKYCGVAQNKSLQLADWRLRPLTNEMLEYARQDTHFLLYIYEQMRNELIEAGNERTNLLTSVYDQSRLSCLKRYEKPVSNAQLALRKTRRSLNNRQLYAFTEIYKWRDETAREKDESWGYVLPNHMLLTIAETLPKEMNGILACCDPVPPLIHSNLGKIHKIITTARELPLHRQSAQKDKTEKKVKLKNWIVSVNSIHDITPIEATELTSSSKIDSEDEASPESPSEPSIISNSWPQPWTEPEGWEKCINRSGGPSLKFNQKRTIVVESPRKVRQSIKTSSLVVDADNLATPFGRYEISKKIIEMAKDPAKLKDLDMNDPLVKTVYEAVMLVVDETNATRETESEQAPTKLAKVLDEGEFIPFNPMADPSPKKRKKNSKYDTLDDGVSNEVKQEDKKNVNVGIGIGLEQPEEDSVEEIEVVPRSKSSSMLQSKSKKTKKKRSGGKLLNRIKNVFQKNKKKESSQSQDQPEEGEIDDDDEEIQEIKTEPIQTRGNRRSNSNQSPPAKRMRHERQSQNQHSTPKSENSSRNRNSDGGRGRGRNNYGRGPYQGQDQDQKKAQRGGRNKNKTGIFKAWKRDNRSITFK